MSRSRLILVTLLLTLAGVQPAVHAADDYAALKARLDAGDTSIDFLALRMAYATSPGYSPNRVALLETRRAVEVALKDGKFDVARPLLETWLAQDYLNPFAHLGAARVEEKTGHADKAKFHNAVVDGLFNSICAEGHGLAEDRPCKVLSIDEEHFFLVMNGFKLEGQHNLLCDGKQPCEALDVTNSRDGKGYTLYMDISLPLAYLQNQQGKAEAPPPPPRAP